LALIDEPEPQAFSEIVELLIQECQPENLIRFTTLVKQKHLWHQCFRPQKMTMGLSKMLRSKSVQKVLNSKALCQAKLTELV
jgi:hypothetical protein